MGQYRVERRGSVDLRGPAAGFLGSSRGGRKKRGRNFVRLRIIPCNAHRTERVALA